MQFFIVLFIATSYHARECFHFVVYLVLLLYEMEYEWNILLK